MEEITFGYTTIQHGPRIRYGLTCNDYCIASLIYHLANNPANQVPGWCTASKEKIGKYFDISRQSVHDIINKLIEKGFVEKMGETGFLKTTNFWYRKMECMEDFTQDKGGLHTVKKGDSGTIPGSSKESLQGVKKAAQPVKKGDTEGVRKGDTGCKESLHYNNSSNNKNNNDSNNGDLQPVAEVPEVIVEVLEEKPIIKNEMSDEVYWPCFSPCRKAFLERNPGYIFNTVDGKQLKNLINYIAQKIEFETGEPPKNKGIIEFFCLFMDNLPQWFKDRKLVTLPKIVSNFETLYQQIKDGNQKPQSRSAANRAALKAYEQQLQQQSALAGDFDFKEGEI